MMLKAQWTVTAAVIPGILVEELTRTWNYTSHDFLQDGTTPLDQPTIFSRYVKESADYAMELQDPASVNVVNLQFYWV